MIRHVVCIRLAADDPAQRAADAASVVGHVHSLEGKIPQLRSLSVGADLGLINTHWDVVLVEDFDSVEDLDTYIVHPEHQVVVQAINPLVAERAIVDFEVPA